MKVALVCDWYHPRVGGIELHLQNLATHLSAAGHEVVVVTPTPGADVVDGIRVRRITAPLAPVFGFLVTPEGIRAIGRVLAEERVDVAHCHVSIVSPAALGGAAEAVRRGVPTVLTFHSVVPQMHALTRVADVALGSSRWPVRFSAVSRRVARDVQPMAGSADVTVLPNGIDAHFWRESMQVPPREDAALRAVSVMRLNPKKRPLALVEMMRTVGSTVGRDVSLRIIGDGPQRTALLSAIARAGLADRVSVMGRLTRTEIRRVLADSDLFVLPTVRESFGLAALEARCAGLPVVAMAASGVSEFIAHEQNGLLARNDGELSEHVLLLARDEPLRRSIAARNRATLPPYDWPTVVRQHLGVYGEATALRDSVRRET